MSARTTRKARRHCAIVCRDKVALMEIDAVAATRRITRGEAVAYIVRECRQEVARLKWRTECIASQLEKAR